MSERTPSVIVDLRFGHQATYDNCEAYQNHATGELVLISLQSGARQAVMTRGAWSAAVITYGGEVVVTLTPFPPMPDYEGDASMLNWPQDATKWPTEVAPYAGLLAADWPFDVGRIFRFVGFRYNADREISGADYRAADGKTLRVANA